MASLVFWREAPKNKRCHNFLRTYEKRSKQYASESDSINDQLRREEEEVKEIDGELNKLGRNLYRYSEYFTISVLLTVVLISGLAYGILAGIIAATLAIIIYGIFRIAMNACLKNDARKNQKAKIRAA